jgi:TetR/AcrR family transcriptional regulator, cholesterol catabolism regulator
VNSQIDLSSERPSEAHERVLQVAELLFSERGYVNVTTRDLAKALGIRQASLYYHAPGGKEQLYVDVTERLLNRFHIALDKIVVEKAPDLRLQLDTVAQWLLSQTAINLNRMMRSDLPALSQASMQRIIQTVYGILLEPIQVVIDAAIQRNDIRPIDGKEFAYLFIVLVESLRDLPQCGGSIYNQRSGEIVELFLDGLRLR